MSPSSGIYLLRQEAERFERNLNYITKTDTLHVMFHLIANLILCRQ